MNLPSKAQAPPQCSVKHLPAAAVARLACRQPNLPPFLLLPAGPDEDKYTGELLPYITGEKQAPVKTYFIGGWGHGSKQALEALDGQSARQHGAWCRR